MVFSQKFYTELYNITSSLGIPIEDVLGLMSIESGFDPTAHNASHASGLLQLMPDWLKSVGFSGSDNDFKNLSAEEQLKYLGVYLKQKIQSIESKTGIKPTSGPQFYAFHWLPVTAGIKGVLNEDPSTIIVDNNPNTKPHLPGVSKEREMLYYRSNMGLDYNKDGVITYGDLVNVFNSKKKSKTFQKVLSELESATGYKPQDNKSQEDKKQIDSEKDYWADVLNYLNKLNNLFSMANKNNMFFFHKTSINKYINKNILNKYKVDDV